MQRWMRGGFAIDHVTGGRRWAARVYPLVVQAGLR